MLKSLPVSMSLFCIAFVTCLVPTMQAKVIADFSEDFNPRKGIPAGWSFQWNPSGVEIDNQVGYVDLEIHRIKRKAVVDLENLPGKDCTLSNAKHLEIRKGMMRPGREAKSATDGIAHYTIACYTIQPGEEGDIRIIESSIKTAAVDGLTDIRIYVNERLIGSEEFSGGEPFRFNVSLGNLSVGDRIYVAVGNVNSKGGSAEIQYQIETL